MSSIVNKAVADFAAKAADPAVRAEQRKRIRMALAMPILKDALRSPDEMVSRVARQQRRFLKDELRKLSD